MIDVVFLLIVVTVVLGAAWCAAGLFGARIAERDLVWRTALIGVVAAPLLVLAHASLSVWQWSLPLLPSATKATAAIARVPETMTDVRAETQEIRTDETVPSTSQFPADRNEDQSQKADELYLSTSMHGNTSGGKATDHVVSEFQPFSRGQIARSFAVVWFIGTVFCLARLVRALWRMQRLIASAKPVTDESVLSIADSIRRQVGLRTSLRIATSDHVRGPVVAGVFRPAILVPASLLVESARAELRMALLHECGHLHRSDVPFNLLQQIAFAMYWFHPLVHVMHRVLQHVREDLCDNYVLAGESAVSYAQTLLCLAIGNGPAAGTVTGMGMFSSHRSLERRVEMLLNPQRSIAIGASRRACSAVTGAALVLALAVILIRVDRVAANDPNEADSLDKPPPALPITSSQPDAEQSKADNRDRTANRDGQGAALSRDSRERTSADPGESPSTTNRPAENLERTPLDALDRVQIAPEVLKTAGQFAPGQLVSMIGDSRLKHWGIMNQAVVSSDGTRIATTGGDGMARIWDAETGYELHCLTSLEGIVGIAFSPDGKLLATGAYVGNPRIMSELVLWDTGTGLARRTITGPGVGQAVTFSPDGTRVAAAGPGSAYVWDVATGLELLKIPAHVNENSHYGIFSTAFSPDGQVLLTSGIGPGVPGKRYSEITKFWNVHSGELLTIVDGSTGPKPFLRDGTIILKREDGAISHWNPTEKKEVRRFSEPRMYVGNPQISPDESVIAFTTADYSGTIFRQSLQVYDFASAKKIFDRADLLSPVTSLAFTPDSRTIAVSCQDGLRFLESGTGKTMQPDAASKTLGLAFSPDETVIALGKDDGSLVFWDVATRKPIATISAHSSWLRSIAFSPDGKTVVTGADADRELNVWDVATKRKLRSFEATQANVFSMRFSADGTKLAVGTGNGTTELFDFKLGKSIRSAVNDSSQLVVRSVAFDRQGSFLASVSLKTVTLHDLAGGLDRRIEAPGYIHAMDVSPDGTFVAVALSSAPKIGAQVAQVVIWNTRNPGDPTILEGHQNGYLWTVAFNPSSTRIASAGRDGSVRIWDPVQARLLETIKIGPPAGEIAKVVFSPSGRHLATVNRNGTVYVLRP